MMDIQAQGTISLRRDLAPNSTAASTKPEFDFPPLSQLNDVKPESVGFADSDRVMAKLPRQARAP
jgi:hypothetical protein